MLIVPLVSMLLETAIDPVHNIVLIHSYTENARLPRSPEDVICTLSESFNMGTTRLHTQVAQASPTFGQTLHRLTFYV
jgi:hypothetical protein